MISVPTGAVTFLFTDIEGSTRHWEQSPGRMREALARHDDIIEGSVAQHSGTIFSKGGDSYCASFDSPLKALEASLEAQRELRNAEWETEGPIEVRMGIHTGTAQLRNQDYFGPTLNRAARLMSAGHGGQILMSSSTQRILVDELPPEVDLVSLGTHYLKDLDRPEEIYQVTADGLGDSFPSLRTDSGSAAEGAAAAVRAYHAKDWQEVVDLLSELESEAILSGEQHEMMGFALWWLGDHEGVIRRFEQTYNAYIAEGNPQGAAVAAIELAELHSHNLKPDIARGWVKRAERLLEDDEDSAARGYLTRWKAVEAFDKANDIELATTLSDKVLELGRVNSDGNLEVLALQDKGRFLVASGELEEGMALLDEAMVAAVAGDVTPGVVGRSYCNMLAVCDQTGDIRRAAEWSEAAERWCQESESSPYPGICRIFKAEVMWLNGDWVGAESEVKRASGELGLYTDISGEAWYQFGVMKLRARDFEAAEAAFEEALTRGREPVPGYAFILHHRGDTEAAIDLINRSLSDPSLSKLDRARFLPPLIEFSLEQSDVETSIEAADELEEIGQLAQSDYFLAQAAHSRGIIALRDSPQAAISHLKEATRRFTELRLPYESARARLDLAKALRIDGAGALATLELKSVRATFDRLGSTEDVAAVEALLAS